MKNLENFLPTLKLTAVINKNFSLRQKTELLKDGDVPERIFFIVGGEAYASNSTGRYTYFKLPEGSYFGDTHVLTGVPLSYSLFYDDDNG